MRDARVLSLMLVKLRALASADTDRQYEGGAPLGRQADDVDVQPELTSQGMNQGSLAAGRKNDREAQVRTHKVQDQRPVTVIVRARRTVRVRLPPGHAVQEVPAPEGDAWGKRRRRQHSTLCTRGATHQSNAQTQKTAAAKEKKKKNGGIPNAQTLLLSRLN